jgi:hypothetical protein
VDGLFLLLISLDLFLSLDEVLEDLCLSLDLLEEGPGTGEEREDLLKIGVR